MRYFLVTAMLIFAGGVQAAQAGSVTVPTVRVNPSVHGSFQWGSRPVTATQAPNGAGGSGKTTSSIQWSGSGGGDKGIIAILRGR